MKTIASTFITGLQPVVKAMLTDALADAGGALTLLARYDILVSGKKAAIYKITKAPS